MPTRRLVHTRSISAHVYVRDDGLWDVEAELVDTKGGDFRLATGTRLAGEPIHHMRLTVTIDTSLNVLAAAAESLAVPYPGACEAIAPDYRQLIGLNLMNGFRREVRLRFGGTDGCTHITELTNVLPTAAIQAFAGEVIRTRDASQDDPAPGPDAPLEHKPFQLDRCHALKSDGAAVAQFYPRWYRPAPDPSKDVPETKPVPERQT